MDLSPNPAPPLFQPPGPAGAFFSFDFQNQTNMATRRHSLAAANLPFYWSRRPEVHAHSVDDVRSRLLNSVYLNQAPRMVIRPKAIKLPFLGGSTDQKSAEIDFLRRSPFSRYPRYNPYSAKTLLSSGEALRLCSLPATYGEEFRSRTPTAGMGVSLSPADSGKVFTVDASFDSVHCTDSTERELHVTKRHNSSEFDNVLLLQHQQQQRRQRFALDIGIPLSITGFKTKGDADIPSKNDVLMKEHRDKKQYEFLRGSDHVSDDTNRRKVAEINVYSNSPTSTLEKLNQNNAQRAFRRKVIDKRTFSYKSRRTNKGFKKHFISSASRIRGSKLRNCSNKIRTSLLSSHNRQEGEMYHDRENTPTPLFKQTTNQNNRKAGEPPAKDNDDDVWNEDLNPLPPQNQTQTTTVSPSDPGENTATSSNLGSKPYTKPSDTDNGLSVPFSLPLTCLGGDRKSFCCPQCRYLTDRKNNLKRHIVTMHQESGKILECCGVAFQSKAALRDHNSIFHRGGYRCQICSRNFCRKALLRRHLTVHSGQKDFFCDLCGYATSHKSNLERHQKVHSKREGTLVLGEPEGPLKKNVHSTSRNSSRSNNSSSSSTHRSIDKHQSCNGLSSNNNNNDDDTNNSNSNNNYNNNSNNNHNNNNNNSNSSSNNNNNSNSSSNNNNNNKNKSNGLDIFVPVHFNNLLLEPQSLCTVDLFPTLDDLDQEDHIRTVVSRSPNELENQEVNDSVTSSDAVSAENVPVSLIPRRRRPRKGGMLRSRLAETYRDNDWIVRGNVDTNVELRVGNDIIPKVEQDHAVLENDIFTKFLRNEDQKFDVRLEESKKGTENIQDGLMVNSVICDQNQEANILKLKTESNEIQDESVFSLESSKRKRLCPLAYACSGCHRKFQYQVTLESHECQRLLCASAFSIPLVTSVRRGKLASLR